MRLLILGGTAFLGRATANAALAHGIDVTCAARGTEQPPPGAPFVRVDREAEDGLSPLAQTRWDAVIDVARQPGFVRRAVRDLVVDHWVYVSSSSVYVEPSKPLSDESAPTLPPLVGESMVDVSEYGSAKVACENAVAQTPSWNVARVGLIGGPGDPTARVGYFPWRFAHPTGPDVLVPDDPELPCSVIDVDDVAQWLVRCATQRIAGTFNVVGETVPLAAHLDAARRAAGEAAPPARPVPLDVLESVGVRQWYGPKSMPLWIGDADARNAGSTSIAKAVGEGLVNRPLVDTLARCLAFENERVGPRGAGLTDDEERALREALPPR